MYKILKIAMAEFSYALEKYFGVTSVLPTIFVIAAAYAMIFSVLFKGAETVYLRKSKSGKKPLRLCPVYLVTAWIVSFQGNLLTLNPELWNSKAHRVMSNFQYVLSFSANRQIFFDALLIPNNVSNQSNAFNIALRLNDMQWSAVKSAADSAAWYFAKVEKAIKQMLRLGSYHLTVNVIDQGWCAYIPCTLLVFLGMILFIQAHKVEGFIVLLAAVSNIVLCLGGAIFLCVMIYFGYGIWIYLDFAAKQRKKRRQKGEA